MLLSARILTDVSGVNAFVFTDAVEFTEGDGPTIYFQLIDASLDRDLRPAGRRYMAASGAMLEVVVHSIDDAKKVTRYASQPFPQDPSIWALALTSTDKVKGTCSLKLTLTEGSKVTRGMADSVVRAYGQTQAR